MPQSIDQINSHYGTQHLVERLLDALTAAGANVDALTRDDLSSFDEFHVGGKQETENLARAVGIAPGTNILDVGCGVGGPARTLAAEFGCTVTGIDATHEFCRAAEVLTARVGLTGKIRYVEGSATDMPFDAAQFDSIWFQHVGMNIDAKKELYAEIKRVLKPDGMFVFHEILEGNGEPLHFPVPWAAEQQLSHLISISKLQEILTRLSFRQEYWSDVTERSAAWVRERRANAEARRARPVSIGALLGRDVSAYFANLLRNLDEGKIIIIEAAYRLG